MAAANFATSTGFGAFFLFPLFISGRGGTETDIGVIMGVFALASVLCRPWVSELIDRVGRKRSFTLGALIMTLLPLAYLSFQGPLAGFYLPLLLVRVIHGVGVALCFTAAFTFIADVVPPVRLNEGIGMFGISGLVGMAVGPVMAELILRHWDFTAFFLAAAAIGGFGLLVHLPVRETLSGRTPRARRIPFFTLLLRPGTRNVVGLALLFGFGLAASENFVAPLAQERKLPIVSWFFGAYSTAAVFTRLWAGRLADRVGERAVIPYALVVIGSGLLALVFVRGGVSLTLAGLLAGCGHGLLFPTLNALAVRGQPAEVRGKITGIYTGSIDSGTFIGSILLGLVAEFIGLGSLFLVAAMALFSGLLIARRV